ncbi:hypothetical protein [Prescottella equi]|uniref:hypothetical protein n=1 Tax=Rhodococcus hoagii TaxID=43767 RepID=UPI001EEB446D|nr:hypothetical protein [Prescottella equi]
MPGLQPLEYCKVVGRFVATVADGVDTDDFPDAVALQGSITFTPSLRSIKVATASPDPATVLPTPITVTLDTDGYVSWRGKRGVFLVAPTSATNPVDWNYTVTFDLALGSQRLQYPPFAIDAPVYVPGSDPADPDSGSTVVDLTLAAPVYPSSGTAITLGPHPVSVSVVADSLVFHMSDGSDLPPLYLQVLHDISASAPVIVQARDDTLEAAGIALGSAEFADARASAADASAASAWAAASQSAEGVPQATASVFGKIKLRGDLGGTAESPTVPALASKADLVGGKVPAAQSLVTSVAGRQGPVTLSVGDVAGAAPVASPQFTGSPAVNGSAVVVASDVRLSDARNTTASRITDASTLGRTVLTAADATAARNAISAASQTDVSYLSPKLVERGAWTSAAVYGIADVVTYNYCRWYCRSGTTGTWNPAAWIFLGLNAVVASSDPGGGQLWVKI